MSKTNSIAVVYLPHLSSCSLPLHFGTSMTVSVRIGCCMGASHCLCICVRSEALGAREVCLCVITSFCRSFCGMLYGHVTWWLHEAPFPLSPFLQLAKAIRNNLFRSNKFAYSVGNFYLSLKECTEWTIQVRNIRAEKVMIGNTHVFGVMKIRSRLTSSPYRPRRWVKVPAASVPYLVCVLIKV